MQPSYDEPIERAGERYQRLAAERKARGRRYLIIGGSAAIVLLLAVVVIIGQRGSVERQTSQAPIAVRTFKPVDDYFTNAAKQFPIFAIEDDTAGIVIMRADVTQALNARFGRTTNLPDGGRDQVMRQLRSQHLMAKRAIAIGMSEDVDFHVAMRRHYIETLAARYLNWKLTAAVEASSAEVDAFIADNPQFFADRKRYSFDAIDLPATALASLEGASVRGARSIDDILVMVKGLGLDYRRRPFAAYSEDLPDRLRAAMPDIIDQKETIFTRRGEEATIMRLLAVDDASIPVADRFRLARSRVLAERRAAALSTIEQDILAELQGGTAPETTSGDDNVPSSEMSNSATDTPDEDDSPPSRK